MEQPSRDIWSRGSVLSKEAFSTHRALKERYETEVRILKDRLGPPKSLRYKMGLSQRKMSELLLVDPASWSRWEKTGDIPPYIYKSLQWFFALKEQKPELATLSWLKTHERERDLTDLEEQISELHVEIEALRKSHDMSLKSLRDRSPEKPSKTRRTRLFVLGTGIFLGGMALGWLIRLL